MSDLIDETADYVLGTCQFSETKHIDWASHKKYNPYGICKRDWLNKTGSSQKLYEIRKI